MPTYHDMLIDKISDLEEIAGEDALLIALELRALRMETKHLTDELHSVVEVIPDAIAAAMRELERLL